MPVPSRYGSIADVSGTSVAAGAAKGAVGVGDAAVGTTAASGFGKQVMAALRSKNLSALAKLGWKRVGGWMALKGLLRWGIVWDLLGAYWAAKMVIELAKYGYNVTFGETEKEKVARAKKLYSLEQEAEIADIEMQNRHSAQGRSSLDTPLGASLAQSAIRAPLLPKGWSENDLIRSRWAMGESPRIEAPPLRPPPVPTPRQVPRPRPRPMQAGPARQGG